MFRAWTLIGLTLIGLTLRGLIPLKSLRRSLPVFLISISLNSHLQAETVRVAVSANFKPVLKSISERFEKQSGHNVSISTASSGTLYNQITNGAPFDLFLSADSARPEQLEEKGLIKTGSRKPYAYGRLVLWDTTASGNKPPLTIQQLKSWQKRIAIANPRTAPYGAAAKQVLEGLGIWKERRKQRVQGNSIQQAWQFVASGNVQIGLVALSQLTGDTLKQVSYIPDNLYQPIRQEMVILKKSQEKQSVQQFADYLLSGESQTYIAHHGYHSVLNESVVEKKDEGYKP